MRHKFADLYELDLKNFLLQETGIPPKFVNDVDAAGRGMWLGAGKPMGRIGCFTLGTGIGSSLLIDGLPLEEQHVADRPGQLWCSKYESGIFEDYVSSHAIRQNYLEIGGGESLTVHEIAELAASGDQVATEALENFGHHLGMAIAFFCDRFEPSRVLIGGKIALSWEQFGSKVQQQVVDSTEFWISADQNSAFLGALDLFPIEADAAEDKS